MKIYIDFEWNSFGGELISVGLAAASGELLYLEFERNDVDNPWVAEHVIPKLDGQPRPVGDIQKILASFLAKFDSAHIVADWPEDIERFCGLLITGPGERINTPPLTMEVVREDAPSDNPHHALADAYGLMRHMEAKRTAP